MGDNLLAWKYTDKVEDWGAASDADLDYALALAFASKRWSAPSKGSLPPYAKKSLLVQQDILKLETGRAGGKLYLQPGTWNMAQAPITVNPSYLSPAHYKIFNQMQADPRWAELTDSAYDVLWKSSQQIGGSVGVGLPANWVSVTDDGSVVKADAFDINYTYDAFRTSFRVGLDYAWFGDSRAKNYLTVSGARNFLLNQLISQGKIFAEYAHDGNPLGRYDNAGVYAINIGWFF
jgi:endo-1,4-beta-D-glucanase Y